MPPRAPSHGPPPPLRRSGVREAASVSPVRRPHRRRVGPTLQDGSRHSCAEVVCGTQGTLPTPAAPPIPHPHPLATPSQRPRQARSTLAPLSSTAVTFRSLMLPPTANPRQAPSGAL
ncbi:MAG: hypothetical protein WDW38_009684 [Sanguina aurantia]